MDLKDLYELFRQRFEPAFWPVGEEDRAVFDPPREVSGMEFEALMIHEEDIRRHYYINRTKIPLTLGAHRSYREM